MRLYTTAACVIVDRAQELCESRVGLGCLSLIVFTVSVDVKQH